MSDDPYERDPYVHNHRYADNPNCGERLVGNCIATPPAPTEGTWAERHGWPAGSIRDEWNDGPPAPTEDACGSCQTPGHFAGDGTHDCGLPALIEAHTGADAPPPHRMAVPDGD